MCPANDQIALCGYMLRANDRGLIVSLFAQRIALAEPSEVAQSYPSIRSRFATPVGPTFRVVWSLRHHNPGTVKHVRCTLRQASVAETMQLPMAHLLKPPNRRTLCLLAMQHQPPCSRSPQASSCTSIGMQWPQVMFRCRIDASPRRPHRRSICEESPARQH